MSVLAKKKPAHTPRAPHNFYPQHSVGDGQIHFKITFLKGPWDSCNCTHGFLADKNLLELRGDQTNLSHGKKKIYIYILKSNIFK